MPVNNKKKLTLKAEYYVSNTHYYIVGKRACPGEPLAKNTFYLFVASLAKKFHFKPIEGQPPPTLEPHVGLTLSYQNFKAVITIRS